MNGANFEGSHRCDHSHHDHRGKGRKFFRHQGFGGPGPHRGGPGGRGGRRARRGDIRQAILLLLAEEPRNGYGLMQEVDERSNGLWRPSPCSVYPALSQLEDEGLIHPVEHEGQKAFSLTDAGAAHVEENREKMGKPWETEGRGGSSELRQLRDSSRTLAVAAMQVAQTGSPEQLKAANEIIEGARKELYRLLAGDTPVPEEEPAG